MKRNLPRRAVLIFAGAWLLTGCGRKEETAVVAQPPVPPKVVVAEATQADVPVFKEAIAKLDGSTNTPIQAQVTGFLIKQAYEEGSVVKAGDLLFLINTKPFQAEPNKAQALDADKTSEAAANATHDYARITSPVGGVAGRAIPGLGDLIRPGTMLMTVSTVDPIQAEFALPEKFYVDNADSFARLMAKPLEERPRDIELILADGTPYPVKGRLSSINRPAENSPGAIMAYALFPNPNRVLRPGQFAKIRGMTQVSGDAVVVPKEAVNELQGSEQVMVVRPDDTVEIRTVTTGDRSGPLWVITSGLKAGERVIVEGGEKCQAGERVTPKPFVAPATDVH